MKIYTATDWKCFTDWYDRNTYNDLLEWKWNKKEILLLAVELYYDWELSTWRLLKTLYYVIVK